MIMRGTTPRTMSRTGFLTTLGLAVLLLPLRPSWSQEPKPVEDPLASPKPPAPAVGRAAQPDPLAASPQTAVERAEARLKWSEKLRQQNAISDAQVQEDRFALQAAKEEAEQKTKDATLKREIEILKLQDDIERLESQLPLKAAIVKKAQGQKGIATAQLDRIKSLKAKGPNFVAKSAQDLADAEMEIAEAGVAEAQADMQITQVQINQSRRRLQALENSGKPKPIEATDKAKPVDSTNPQREAWVAEMLAAIQTKNIEIEHLLKLKARWTSAGSRAELEKVNAEVAVAKANIAQIQSKLKQLEEGPTANPQSVPKPTTSRSLRNIALAFYNYNSAKDHFPAAAIVGTDGKPLLSWRVAILPYLDDPGANDLYKQFKLDEPWDSPHNKTLLVKMPQTYGLPASNYRTPYRAIVGPETAMDMTQGFTIASFTDMTKNTLLVVDSNDFVPWTKPEDIAFSLINLGAGQNPVFFALSGMPDLGVVRRTGFAALFADGSVRTIKLPIAPNVYSALATRAGGEILSEPEYGRAIPGNVPVATDVSTSTSVFTPTSPPRDSEQRLSDMESKLDRVLKELEEIRKEKAAKPGAKLDGADPMPKDKIEKQAGMSANGSDIGDFDRSFTPLKRIK